MSKDIFETDKMQVTAFVGQNGNASVQIGMKGDNTYEQLNSEQVAELANVLLKRIARKEGYRATDS